MGITSQINTEFLYRALQDIPAAVLLVDHNFHLMFANASFQNFSGLSPSQLSGTGWADCIVPKKRQVVFNVLSELNIPEPSSRNIAVQLKANPDAAASLSIACEPDSNMDCIYFLTFSPAGPQKKYSESNILTIDADKTAFNLHPDQTIEITLTDKKRKSPDLQSAKNLNYTEKYVSELKASNKLKDKILAIISHDMSAPIASLKGLTSAFLDEELTVKERLFVRESLLKQLDSVGELTENLLRWATNSFTKQDSETKEPLHVLNIIEQNIQLVIHQAHAKNIKIACDIPDDLTVFANIDQLNLVIRNVITNSIKYTALNGEINISGTRLESYVQIRVKDTGIGILKKKLSTLFTYTHNSTYGTNGEKGIGLGLMLCKEYVEANGGKISVSSKRNFGTTVFIELPAA